MFTAFISDEAWLNGTNALLGIVAGLALLAIAGAILHDVLQNARQRTQTRQHFVFDPHVANIPELGLTMADGGEPTDDNLPPKK